STLFPYTTLFRSNNSACGTRSLRKAPRRAVTIRSLPRNSAKPISAPTLFGFQRHLRGQKRTDRCKHVRSDLLGRSHRVAFVIKTFDGDPRRLTRQRVVHFACLLKMPQTSLQQI